MKFSTQKTHGFSAQWCFLQCSFSAHWCFFAVFFCTVLFFCCVCFLRYLFFCKIGLVFPYFDVTCSFYHIVSNKISIFYLKKKKINMIVINKINERIYNYFILRWQIQRNLKRNHRARPIIFKSTKRIQTSLLLVLNNQPNND